MNFIWRLLLLLVKHQAKLRFLAQAKKTGTLAYLRALQGTRRVMVAVLLAFLMLQFMVLAAFGALITGIMLWDADQHFKLQILFAAFLGIAGLPALVLSVLFSERLWYKISGAEKLVENVRERENFRDAA